MKKMLLALSLLLFPLLLSAQHHFPLRSSTDSLRFTLTDEGGQLTLAFTDPGNNAKSSMAFPQLLSVTLDDADLVLDYQIKRLKERLAYDVEVEILGPGGRPLSRKLRETAVPAGGRKNRTGQLRWMDATENALNYGQAYTLLFHKSLLSEVDCQGERPAFGLKKQWPHYLVAGAGLAVLGFGEYYRREKEDQYDNYQELWRNGRPLPDAQPYFTAAEDNRRKAEDYTLAGLIILSADALFFAYRWWMVEKSRRIYDQYCPSSGNLSWELLPRVEWAPGTLSTVGLTFQMHF